MKLSTSVLFCTILVTMAIAGPTTAPAVHTTGFGLSVARVPDFVTAGELVIVTVGITNVTDNTLSFKENDGADDFDVEVYKDDKLAARTQFGKSVVHNDGIHTLVNEIYPELKPSTTLWYSIDVTRRFDMTTAGDYTIRISRSVPALDGPRLIERHAPTGRVTADDLRIKVVDPQYSGGSTSRPT